MIGAHQDRDIGAKGIWPLFILMVSAIIYPLLEGTPGGGAAGQPAAQGGGWVRLVFFSLSYLLAGLFLLPHMQVLLALCRRMWAYLLMLCLIAASALWSAFPDKVVFNFVHNLGALLVSASAALYCVRRTGGLATPTARVTTLIVLLSVVMVFVKPSIGIEPNDIWGTQVDRWRGITDNANTLGACAALSICCALSALFAHRERGTRLMALVTMPISAYVLLVGCRSMTSILAGLAFVGLFLALMNMEKNSPGGRMVKAFAAFMLLGLVMTLVFLARPDMDLGDLFFKLTGRSKTLTGRTMLWQMAFNLIDLKPWLGWSFDSIASARKFLTGAMGYGQFHNGYLDLGVRGGFAALFLLALMLLRMVRAGMRQARTHYRNAAFVLSMTLFMVVSNIAEASFFVDGSPIWFLLMATWTYAETQTLLAAQAGEEAAQA